MINPKKELAENIDLSTYETTPIESYGLKMLQKMSSNNNTNLNRKRKAPEVIEFKPRNHRSGLGFEMDRKNIKLKEEELLTFYGTMIIIIEGKYKGQKGKIVSLEKSDSFKHFLDEHKYIDIQLESNGEKTQIKSKYLNLYKEDIKKEMNDEIKNHTIVNKSKLEWVLPNITVRIIKEDSKYYNTKAKIIDVMDEYSFSLLTSDNVLHTSFSENDIETVLPKISNDVLILTGEHKNKIAKLLLRDMKQNKVNVQLLDDLSLVELTQDDVCAISN